MPTAGLRRLAFLCLMISTCQLALAADVTSQAVKDALPKLDALAEQILKKTGVPGMAIAVVHKDKVVHLKGFGVRQMGTEAAIDADTVFQLASVSKPVTSTILAALVGEGKLGWDDRLMDRDPAFRLMDPLASRAVTVRDMLCHRSGLAEHEGDLLEDLGYDRAEVLRRLRFARPASSFRSRYAYTNFGYIAAAVAGARTTGMAWEDVAATKLFEPLGMKSSSYRFADYAARENRARLHVQIDGKWVARHVREPDAQAPAGGVSSSIRDLAKWVRLHLARGKFEGKQIIAAQALDETHRPQIISNPPKNPAKDRAGFYCLGWGMSYTDEGQVRLNHSGAFSLGAATTVTLLPAENLGIVVLTNAYPIGVAEAVAASFFDLVQKGKVEKDWLEVFQPLLAAAVKPENGPKVDYSKLPGAPTPPLENEVYLGKYHNDYFGDIEIVKKDRGLALLFGPKRATFPMRHWNRDVFLFQPDGENADGASGVLFSIGPDRCASHVVIENLDIHKQGTFTRVLSKK